MNIPKHQPSETGFSKVGITIDNYKQIRYTAELNTLGYAFNVRRLTGKTKVITVRVANEDVPKLREMCNRLELTKNQN